MNPGPGLKILGLALIYFLAGRLGLSLASIHPSASAIWPPTGIAIAALVLGGRGLWPGIFLGAFLVNFTTSSHVAASLGIATGNTLEALAAALLVEYLGAGRRVLESSAGIFRFAALAGCAAPAVSATFGVLSLCLAGLASWPEFGPIWLTWYLGDMGGALIVAPMIIAWAGGTAPSPAGSRFEFLLMLLCTGLTGAAVFGGTTLFRLAPTPYPFGFFCLLPLVWAAFRFGVRGTALASFFLSLLAVFGIARAHGPDSLPILQTLLNVCAVTGLGIAGVVAERSRDEILLRQAQSDLSRRVDEAVAALKVSEGRFQKLFESAPDALVMINRRREILLINEQTERLFGYEEGELLGRPIEALVPDRLKAIHPAHVERFFERPEPRPMGAALDLTARRRDGSEFPVEISLAPVETSEGLIALAAIRDVTSKRVLEEKEERLRAENAARHAAEAAVKAREEFIAIASHELYTPLAALKLHVDNLVRLIARDGGAAVPGEKLAPALAAISSMTRRIQHQIMSMLDVSRIQTGQFQIGREPAEMGEIVRAVMNRLRPELDRAGARVTIEGPGDGARCEGLWDTAKIEQVVTNLLMNAVRYAGAEPIHIVYGAADRRVRLEVRDRGPGIPAEERDRIFAAFKHGSHDHHSRSLGLGLYIVREIVRRHDGVVRVESREGEGATFTVELPAEETAAAEKTALVEA